MDLNLVVLNGVFAADPEHRVSDSGTSLLRCLITVRSDNPRRVDVIPVVYWEPNPAMLQSISGRGQRVWMAGTVQRRFWAEPDGRKSRLEIVARTLEPRTDEETARLVSDPAPGSH